MENETKTEEAPDWAISLTESIKACAEAVAALGVRVDTYAATKDAAEREKEKETAYADTQRELAALKAQMPRDLSDKERNAIADAQARADSVFAGIGKKMPFPMMGEGALAFRRRLAGIIQPLSKTWGGIDLKTLPEPAFANAEAVIYADAEAYARTPGDIQPYELRPHTVARNGHMITTYKGDPRAWMEAHMPPTKTVAAFKREEIN